MVVQVRLVVVVVMDGGGGGRGCDVLHQETRRPFALVQFMR
jgi:hypothetical protein